MISALNFKIGGGGGACADATVQNSDLSYQTTVASGGTLALPDITLTEGDETTSTKPSAVNLTCKPFPIGATLMKTGQTTSYRTGDDGDFEAGRATNFTTLAKRNPFSNLNRFTSELGTQTYTNNIVIDWSTYDGATVLGYYRIATVAASWNAAIDAALALSIGTFTSGWRMPNKLEMESICNYGTAFILNYSPFNLNTTIWISTTYLASTTSAYTLAQSWVNLTSKTTSGVRWIACRTFTVTGTTLS